MDDTAIRQECDRGHRDRWETLPVAAMRGLQKTPAAVGRGLRET
jgi:hypothetical protein